MQRQIMPVCSLSKRELSGLGNDELDREKADLFIQVAFLARQGLEFAGRSVFPTSRVSDVRTTNLFSYRLRRADLVIGYCPAERDDEEAYISFLVKKTQPRKTPILFVYLYGPPKFSREYHAKLPSRLWFWEWDTKASSCLFEIVEQALSVPTRTGDDLSDHLDRVPWTPKNWRRNGHGNPQCLYY